MWRDQKLERFLIKKKKEEDCKIKEKISKRIVHWNIEHLCEKYVENLPFYLSHFLEKFNAFYAMNIRENSQTYSE